MAGYSCDHLWVTKLLTHGERQFQAMAYHDAVQGDSWAIELAELVDGELGPSVVTVLFGDEPGQSARVLVGDGDLPLPVLRAFMVEVTAEEVRLQGMSQGSI